jgi:hypothetical protein
MALTRRLTLAEWFLDHQLQHIQATRFHVPFYLDLDVTTLFGAWAEEERVPLTAIVVKAVGVWGARHPELNCMLFRGFWGQRVVEFDQVHINLPVVIRNKDGQHLSATVIRDADQLSLGEIRKTIREAATQDPTQLPVGRYLWGRRNTVFNRTRLRLIHWVVNRFPGFYVRAGGGGIGVSSLLNNRERVPYFAGARGANAVVVTPTSTREDDKGRTLLQLGVTLEHSILGGDALAASLGTLREIFENPKDAGLTP